MVVPRPIVRSLARGSVALASSAAAAFGNRCSIVRILLVRPNEELVSVLGVGICVAPDEPPIPTGRDRLVCDVGSIRTNVLVAVIPPSAQLRLGSAGPAVAVESNHHVKPGSRERWALRLIVEEYCPTAVSERQLPSQWPADPMTEDAYGSDEHYQGPDHRDTNPDKELHGRGAIPYRSSAPFPAAG